MNRTGATGIELQCKPYTIPAGYRTGPRSGVNCSTGCIFATVWQSGATDLVLDGNEDSSKRSVRCPQGIPDGNRLNHRKAKQADRQKLKEAKADRVATAVAESGALGQRLEQGARRSRSQKEGTPRADR